MTIPPHHRMRTLVALRCEEEEKEATQEETVARKSSLVKKASSCLLLLSTRSRPNDLRQPTAAVTVTLARKFCHKKRTLERRRSPLAGLSSVFPLFPLRGFRARPLLRWEGGGGEVAAASKARATSASASLPMRISRIENSICRDMVCS